MQDCEGNVARSSGGETGREDSVQGREAVGGLAGMGTVIGPGAADEHTWLVSFV